MNERDVTIKAFSDIGASLNIKGPNGKYHYFMAVENTGATGSAPNKIDLNVIGTSKIVQVAGKEQAVEIELTCYGTRDNYAYLESIKGTKQDLLIVNPDGCGFSFSGTISYWQDDMTANDVIKGKISITVTKAHTFINNCLDLLEPLAYIEAGMPNKVTISGTGTSVFTVETFPATATITATSSATSIATVSVIDKTVTVTGVATGNSIITLKATATGYADRDETLIAFVTE